MVRTGNLRKQDFAGQDLRGAVFHDADLYRARFDGARLEGAVFAGCFAAEATFEAANCTELRATNSNFFRCSFRTADLSGSLFWDCVLAGSDLRGASLKRITLTLDCNSFEDIRIGRAASAELAYLFGRARSPHQQGWLDVVGDRGWARLGRLFNR